MLQENPVKDDRPTTSVTYTAPETTNLGNPNVDTRRAGQYSALGQEPVEVQEPVGGQKIVINNDMQLPYASALLDPLGRLRCRCAISLQKAES